MDSNQLNNKLADLENRIKELEKQSRAYQAEKNDNTARTNAEQNRPQGTTTRAEAEQLRHSFKQNYDSQMLQNIKDSFARDGETPEVKKYREALRQVNTASAQHNLPQFESVV